MNQAMKFGQVIGYNKRKFSFKNHAENEKRRLVPHIFLFLKIALHEIKQKVCSLVAICFGRSQLAII